MGVSPLPATLILGISVELWHLCGQARRDLLKHFFALQIDFRLRLPSTAKTYRLTAPCDLD